MNWRLPDGASTRFSRRLLHAMAAVLDDAAIKWLAAVSSTSDDAVMGVAWSSGSDEDLEARE